jgi:4-alpha-methyl-delta7-sterol-4alpha-methyl oxidase
MDPWQQFVASLPFSNQFVFVSVTWFVHISMYWFLNFLLMLCYTNNWFMKYRIQGKDLPPPSLWKECLRNELINHALIQPVALWYTYPYFVKYDIDVTRPAPDILTVIRDILIFICVNDTLFYWAHRMLHHKYIYKYIHKHHHRFKVNIGIAAEFAHPVEDILANLLPTVLGAFLMKSHPITLWIWLYIRIAETIDAHSGYHFPFSPFHIFDWQGGAARHDFHHSHNIGCYGSFTIFWDWLCGTDKAFLEFQAGKAIEKQD